MKRNTKLKFLHSDNEFRFKSSSEPDARIGYFVLGHEDAPDAPPVTIAAEHPNNQGASVEQKGGLLGNVTLLAVNSAYAWNEQMNAEEMTCYLLKQGQNGEPNRAFIQPLQTHELAGGEKTASPFGKPIEIPIERLEKVIGQENYQKICQSMYYNRMQEQEPER